MKSFSDYMQEIQNEGIIQAGKNMLGMNKIFPNGMKTLPEHGAYVFFAKNKNDFVAVLKELGIKKPKMPTDYYEIMKDIDHSKPIGWNSALYNVFHDDQMKDLIETANSIHKYYTRVYLEKEVLNSLKQLFNFEGGGDKDFYDEMKKITDSPCLGIIHVDLKKHETQDISKLLERFSVIELKRQRRENNPYENGDYDHLRRTHKYGI